MPVEFWREVVDRVAAEVPDTLLLAEAFWLMEGYFVRTLGMHRVYNSAFMHMLRDEKNAQYQQVIRETVSFDARILGRYVNFMNNPDERSAIDQFGSHDKYFGVATLLATLPGLPMFGHGQVEGYSEQYGMEFRRPQRDERPDQGLIDRHRRRDLPAAAPALALLRRRRLPAAHRARGRRRGARRVRLRQRRREWTRAAPGSGARWWSILNRYPRAHVRIPGVAEALGLGDDPDGFVILHDQRSGLDYLRQIARPPRARPGAVARWLRLPRLPGLRGGLATPMAPAGPSSPTASGLAGVPDAHLALRRMRDEPVREAVAAVFATRVAEEAFLPEPASDPDTQAGADAARAALAGAIERLEARDRRP